MSSAFSLRRPRAIIFDILGTASKSGFLEQILFPFLKLNLDHYINTHWNKKDFMKLYTKIMDQSVDFNKQEPTTPVVLPHNNAQAKGSLINFITFVTDNQINSPAVTQLRFKVWFEGYQQSKIRTPIYSDVPNRMRQWFAEGIKFYVFSNTWVEAQRALLRNTNHGDLTNLISGHYDNEFGVLTEADSWRRLSNEIRFPVNDILFLTKSSVEARAASDAGISVVLVLTHRHNVKAVSKEDRTRFPYVRTLNDLVWVEDQQQMAPVATGAQDAPVGPIATAMSTQPTGGVSASNVTGTTTGPASSGLVSGGSGKHSSRTSGNASAATSSQQTRG